MAITNVDGLTRFRHHRVACHESAELAGDCSHPLEKETLKMPLLNIAIVLIVVGLLLHLINRYFPMASSIKSILNVVVIICVCIWLLQVTGLMGSVSSFRLEK